ncbi:MAG TPA: cardiolipin synthase ClsB [Methylophilus sp.]|nr:cardiolipin synthase ClsB [Methylophilus sp.]HQQ33453.1 cardiolipin synthase ClsB [Methylophilus sp.]
MSGGNQITLLKDGVEFFPALETAIDEALHEIYIQTYIFEFDHIGIRIANALKRAAQRGVLVCVLLDGFGCRTLDKSHIQLLEQAGVNVMIYRPRISPWTLKRNRLRRMHRKMAVIDGRVGFVGGINIIDDNNTPDHVPPRIDYAVRVEGFLLQSMRHSVTTLWQKMSWLHFRKKPQSRLPKILPKQQVGNMHAKLLLRDNVMHRRDIEDAYLELIRRAEQEILIANAYFLPGLRFRHALRDAAKRGVKVILLLQGRVEYVLLDFASHALYSHLLRDGIEIHEYRKSFMHSKVAVVDGRWAMVGSSNIDLFSLLMSHEANVLVDDFAFATNLRQDLLQAMAAGAVKQTLADWQQQHHVKRLFSWLVYGLVRVMMGFVGYSEKRTE